MHVKIVQITPGAGKMYCGGCFRDNALVAELRKLGHAVTMLPLYLPLTLEDPDQTVSSPIFFGGVSVYLDQKSAFFRRAPRWLHRLFASPTILKLAAGSAAKTKASEVGELTISMLRGENGHQACELEEMITWLKENDRPEIVSLSNVLLAGLARKIKAELKVPVVCSLQGEDSFLDGLPENLRGDAWSTLAQRAEDIDVFIAPSFYFSDLMGKRLRIPGERRKVVYNGINLEGFSSEPITPPKVPTLGYFARMCREKGLDLLVDSYIELRSRSGTNVKLKIGGSLGPADEDFVNEQKTKLKKAGLLADCSFHPNLNRSEKIQFLESLSVFCVPAVYGEAFGLYVIEAMAARVPAVLINHAAFPELLRAAGGGGIVVEPTAESISEAIERLISNPAAAREMGEAGRSAVEKRFTSRHMASEISQVFRQTLKTAATAPHR